MGYRAVRACQRMFAALLAAIGFVAVPAAATQTVTAQFLVTATVQSSCAVSATGGTLAFGAYTASSATPLDMTTSIGVTCSNGMTYTIALDGGSNTSDVAARAMTDGTHDLTYVLYSDSGHNTVWGDGTGGTSATSASGSGASQPYTIYGRVPVSQYVDTGSYQDTITVSVIY